MPGIGLITNPRSRQNRRDPSRPRKLGYLIGDNGRAEATASLDDLQRVCDELRRADIDVLAISGGDGTLHHTLTAAIRAWGEAPLPRIAILRGGTMNTIARSLGLRGETQRLLFELTDRSRRGLLDQLPTLERPLLRVDREAEPGAPQFGFIFGTGVIHNFLDAYYATGHPSPEVAARLVAEAVGSVLVGGPLAKQLTARFVARVTADGEEWARQDFLALAASTVEEIGLGFRPFYRASAHTDHFALLGIHTSALGFVLDLPAIFAGRPMRRDKVIDRAAREVRLEPVPSDERAGQRPAELAYILDGDTYRTSGALRLSVGPVLRILRLSGEAARDAIDELDL